MDRYRDINGNSGVAAYENGEEFIRVQFKDDSIYLYTNQSAGADNITRMKILAENGSGLNSFINRHVRDSYLCKEQ